MLERRRGVGNSGLARMEIWLAGLLAISLCMVASGARAQQQQQPQPAPQQVPAPYYPAQPYYVAQPQPYYAPQPQAPQRPTTPHTEERANLGLIISGAVILGVGWVVNILSGVFAGVELFGSDASSEWDAFRFSAFVPIAGPWIQLATKPTSFSQDYWGPWLIIDGLLQATGLTMLVIGIATPRTETVYSERPSEPSFAFVPSISPGYTGGTLVGTF
jgi:hypothetical protein